MRERANTPGERRHRDLKRFLTRKPPRSRRAGETGSVARPMNEREARVVLAELKKLVSKIIRRRF